MPINAQTNENHQVLLTNAMLFIAGLTHGNFPFLNVSTRGFRVPAFRKHMIPCPRQGIAEAENTLSRWWSSGHILGT